MRHLRLFLTGLCMGIADLIPGISGGTVAFLAGIYEELLLSIQTIKFQGFKKIAWPFLLPLGAGIATAFLSLTPLVSYLLKEKSTHTYAFFFGVIFASTVLFLKTVKLNKLWNWGVVVVGVASLFVLTSFTSSSSTEFSFLFLVMSGALASSAMLLPGISGSYVLYLLGVYQLAIGAIASQSDIVNLLLPLAIGIVLGLLFFSRVVSFCLTRFKGFTLSLLTGLMIGGLKQIWPFQTGEPAFPILFAFIGFFLVMALEFMLKRKSMETRFKD